MTTSVTECRIKKCGEENLRIRYKKRKYEMGEHVDLNLHFVYAMCVCVFNTVLVKCILRTYNQINNE